MKINPILKKVLIQREIKNGLQTEYGLVIAVGESVTKELAIGDIVLYDEVEGFEHSHKDFPRFLLDEDAIQGIVIDKYDFLSCTEEDANKQTLLSEKGVELIVLRTDDSIGLYADKFLQHVSYIDTKDTEASIIQLQSIIRP